MLIYLDADRQIVIKYPSRENLCVWLQLIGGKLLMSCYFKMLLSLLPALSAVLFMCGVAADRAVAALQDEAVMTEEEYAAYLVEYEAYEAEYAAWDAADKETDILKSGTMLIEFMREKQDSKLVPHAETSFKRLLAKCFDEKKYQELETLAEQWNEFKPGDQNTIALIATASGELKHFEKYIWALEQMYKDAPKLDIAKELARSYHQIDNTAKYIEWIKTILTIPEEASNFRLYHDLFRHYSAEKDTVRAMEYALATLTAIERTENPSEDDAKELPDIRHGLNHSIGVIHFNDKKFNDAIACFVKALEDKNYPEGFFLIGRSLWEQQKLMNAMYAFAKAQLVGESDQASEEDKAIAVKAKESMEQLHRAIYNNTLVNIERRYQRAREMSIEDMLKPME